MWVMSVANHKTAVRGPAMLTMDDDHHHKVGQYVEKIRPVLDPLESMENLLLIPVCNPSSRCGHSLKDLKDGMKFPYPFVQ